MFDGLANLDGVDRSAHREPDLYFMIDHICSGVGAKSAPNQSNT
jgi:hypothetical protein